MSDPVYVITGATGGIGTAPCERLAARGAAGRPGRGLTAIAVE